MGNELDRLRRALAGRYRVDRELGRGGMGTVYLGHDLKHDRSVALKVLRPELAAPVGAERFLREITLTARIDHPHILPLLDSGKADGLLYYVMPYVEGESLRDRLNREKQLPLEDALAITGEVADALSYAHSHNIIHRDIKPENILLAGGHARVADFGIARALTTATAETRTATGVAVGTAVYMSPEQVSGACHLDARTDIYSLACVAYEMLAGAPPFSGPSQQAILVRKCVEPVPSLRSRQSTVPDTVERVIMRALATAPADRYSSAAEMASTLKRAYSEAVVPATMSVPVWRLRVRSRLGVGLIALVLAVIGASAWVLVQSASGRRALEQALPEIERLVNEKEFVAAYRLARRAERHLAANPQFQRLWHGFTAPLRIRTTPAGARVYLTDYRTPEDRWDFLGVSPIEETRVPVKSVRFRVEKAGFQTLEGTQFRGPSPLVIEFTLDAEDHHPGMINVPSGSFPAGVRPLSLRSVPSAQLEPYWLDRYEVTNRQFNDFVQRGGYRERQYWPDPIVVDGRVVPWEEGIRAFVDRTGRPGASTWALGTFHEGKGDYPVTGVSWYEASAYCAYAGKRLPTLYHWYNAVGLNLFSDILALSNIDAREPAPVGRYRGIGPYGHYDMAGNVREWVLNPVRDRRYILGGAWSDPGYMLFHPNAVSAGDRSPTNGFRCAIYGTESTDVLAAELDVLPREFSRKPVDDAFRLYKSLYSYDPTPLNARIESVDDGSPHWRRETVSFDAPYGGRERIVAHLFLPRTGNPPFQAVVYYPGSGAFALESSRDLQTWPFDFLVRTGRAVIHPVYEGMYERRPGSALFRERMIHWTMDIRRSIDYMETRDDVDATRVAYYGFSAGAVWGPVFTANERRFKASILFAGGLFWQEAAAEIEPANFAPHATAPVLMVNGRDDFIYPPDPSQQGLFRLLGAPDQHKRHALLEGGHVPSDMQVVMREVLNWLDRYLEPVK
jgi:eukaryotic-like serine/threonine-protein kinase